MNILHCGSAPDHKSNIPVRTTHNYKSTAASHRRYNPNSCFQITNASNSYLPCLFLSNSRLLVYKIDELSSTASVFSADIVVITETWLSSNIDNSVINLSGFSTFWRDRSDGRPGGGVCGVNKRLPVVHLEEFSNPDFESMWLLIKPNRLPRGVNSII